MKINAFTHRRDRVAWAAASAVAWVIWSEERWEVERVGGWAATWGAAWAGSWEESWAVGSEFASESQWVGAKAGKLVEGREGRREGRLVWVSLAQVWPVLGAMWSGLLRAMWSG